MRRLARRLGEERGQALIEGLLALGLVLLVVAFAAEAITYAHARNVAQAAAQDGARAAAAGGTQAGIDRANAILAVSLAFARAHAAQRNVPLYQHFADMIGQPLRSLPRLTINPVFRPTRKSPRSKRRFLVAKPRASG